MKSAGIWFILSCKRYLRKMSFLLILLILPAAAFFVRGLEREEGQKVRIAVCAEQTGGQGEDGLLEEELIEALEEKKDTDNTLFQFYRCEDEDQVKAQVASRRAECGYVISGDLRRRLDEKDYKRCIKVYSAPSTVLSPLSTEVVSAALMKLYDREIFLDYIMESEILQESETAQKPGNRLEILAGQLYDKWLNNGSTFRFEYRYRNRAGGEKEPEMDMIFPVRGIAAVYLLLTGLYSAVMLGIDEKKGLFLPLPPGKAAACRLAVLGAPVFLGALSAFGALKSGGCLGEPVRELWIMGGYGLAVCLFSYGMKIICRRPQVLCCLIPLFLVGSLIFTPVFVDVRQFFPVWGWIERLFLPSYYLRAF